VAPVDAWPESVAKIAQFGDYGLAPADEFVELIVDAGELDEEVLTPGVQLEASATVETGGVPHRELSVRAIGGRGEGHRGSLSDL
jgi:hypothetical protein